MRTTHFDNITIFGGVANSPRTKFSYTCKHHVYALFFKILKWKTLIISQLLSSLYGAIRRRILYKYAHLLLFLLSAARLFSCSCLRGTQAARPNTTAQVWALAKVRGGVGSKLQVTKGRRSDHVRRTIKADANPRTSYKYVQRIMLCEGP